MSINTVQQQKKNEANEAKKNHYKNKTQKKMVEIG